MDGLYSFRSTSADFESGLTPDRDGERARGWTQVQTVSYRPLGRTIPHRANLRFAARQARSAARGHAESAGGHLQLSRCLSRRATRLSSTQCNSERRADEKIGCNDQRLERNRRTRYFCGSLPGIDAPGSAAADSGAVPRHGNRFVSLAESSIPAESTHRAAGEMAACDI